MIKVKILKIGIWNFIKSIIRKDVNYENII